MFFAANHQEENQGLEAFDSRLITDSFRIAFREARIAEQNTLSDNMMALKMQVEEDCADDPGAYDANFLPAATKMIEDFVSDTAMRLATEALQPTIVRRIARQETAPIPQAITVEPLSTVFTPPDNTNIERSVDLKSLAEDRMARQAAKKAANPPASQNTNTTRTPRNNCG